MAIIPKFNNPYEDIYLRLIIITLLTSLSLFAIGEKTLTMKADFVQTITDEKNSTLIYKGDMLAKRPSLAKWHYSSPIDKTVYITAHEVTIVEPELEQAIVKKLSNSIDILAILATAVKVRKNHYTAYYDEKEYHILMNGDKIVSISYRDAFDNTVKITFSNQQINTKIDDTHFQADIPLDFDVIKD